MLNIRVFSLVIFMVFFIGGGVKGLLGVGMDYVFVG